MNLRLYVIEMDAWGEERGWNQPAGLARVVTDEDGPQLQVKVLDAHPLDLLLGFTAPADWLAMGLTFEGWSLPPDAFSEIPVCRPSQHPRRVRMRSAALVDRHGSFVSGFRPEGGAFKLIDEAPVGRFPDVLRRALGVPSPDTGASPCELYAVWWLIDVVGAAGAREGKGALRWREVAAQHPGARMLSGADDPPLGPDHDDPEWLEIVGRSLGRAHGWARLRAACAAGELNLPIAPKLAEWMDDPMFAQWVLAESPSLGDLVDSARALLHPSVSATVERLLRAWGLAWESPLTARMQASGQPRRR